MRKLLFALVAMLLFSLSCALSKPDPNTLVMIIESSPTNLDPRIGLDAQSERVDELLFDALVRRDEHFNLQPSLAERWEIPDPLTYIFHLRHDVRFHNGQLLTSRDVKWTLDSLISGKLISPKASTYNSISSVEAPDDWTVILHLKQAYSSLLWNLSDGAFGVVPNGSTGSFSQQPIGSGPFKFVSARQDRDLVIERNDQYWGEKPHLQRVRFIVVPDETTQALELRKGSADAVINALKADTVRVLQNEKSIQIDVSPGSNYAYLAFNMRDPILKDVRVRQAIAYAIDRQEIIHYLMNDMAKPANSVLPPQSWASNPGAKGYPHDPDAANRLLDSAGYMKKNGNRFQLAMKTSTDGATRVLAAALQQQMRAIGIDLQIRTFEFATFYSDVTKGAYQIHSLRWIGGNQDPDIFESIFATDSFAPKRQNRTFYSNPRVDELIKIGRSTVKQEDRKRAYFELQEIVNRDVPYVNLWYFDNVLVHTVRVRNLHVSAAGNYDFLLTAELAN
ncbi:ABC peptide transporter, periplasmic ligand binding protein [Candidatus Koribacter versatilis Ellin345]|uniref:ABC peptide transporter, periplasmic ligand binding protein n=1 Tax=Koribacter versatilis (strain Ellin345) TaxID=204669 RepID=Q1IQ61_KORVE|nr:ABC transporter substrate-binding protein [Candidatus Koribacter versatilis]ABF40989.1 ABC peptide transporter, periplasmic ligand binding protein [Candidatus Koribacter versatilis Ellin345]